MIRIPSLVLFAAVFLAGCGSVGVGSDAMDGSSFPPSFERDVAPFEIIGEDGRPLMMPMLGGLNVPRAQFNDIDADGDPDMFIQEAAGRVKFFENTGTPSTPEFTWRTDAYQDLDVGEWYRMLDVDGDGDIDILSEERFSYVRYYRNEGTPQNARFVVAVDSLRDADGTPIFADRQNIPHITDIDCDGNLDLFIGRVTGTITRYESIGMTSDNVPRFRFVEDRWEDIEIVGENVSLHGANTMTFGDIDGDGDQDLFWGDFFEAGLLLIRNQGSCGAPSLRGEPQNFPLDDPIETSGYNAPVLVDLDSDGDLDLFMGVLGGAFNSNGSTRENFYYFEHVGPENFQLRTSRAIRDLDVGSESIVKLADMDGDGDLDMYVGNKIEPDNQKTSLMFYYENTGTATSPAFAYREAVDLTSTYHQNPAIADLDGDGDLDFLVGKWNREMAYFRNDGTARAASFIEVDPVYVSLTRGQNTTPVLVDIDADGDLDLFSGEASGNINHWVNNGTATAPAFELVSDTYQDIDIGRRAFPAFTDLDGDGDQDMIVGTELDGLLLYLNTGTPQVPHFEAWGALDVPVQAISAPEFADIDGDGDMDLFVGGASGGVQFYRNTSR